MRTTLAVLVVVIPFGLCACENGPGSQAKSVAAELKPRDVLVGMWKITDDQTPVTPFVSYEFGADGTLKIVLKDAKIPVTGKYAFITEYTLEVEYDRSDAIRRAYAEAAGSFKKEPDHVLEKMKQMGRSKVEMPSELPAKEKLTVKVRKLGVHGGQAGETEHYSMLLETEQNLVLKLIKSEPTAQ
jgi:hypothetical protein